MRFGSTMAIVALAAVLHLGGVSPALGANRLVTKLADTNDGSCNADCSLREAIAASAVGDVVIFDGTLSGIIPLSLGQLVIDKRLTIVGPGREVLTVSGGYTQRIFRILATGDLTASGLTFAQGQGEFYAPLSDLAGGVAVNSGALSFTDCRFTDNHSDGRTGNVNNDAAVIYSDGVDKTVRVTRCIFDHNTAGAGTVFDVDAGTLIITDSMFYANVATHGVTSCIISNGRHPAVIEGSTFMNNTSISGGAVYISNVGGTTIRNSTFTKNNSGLNGGAIYTAGTVRLNNVTLSGNTASTGRNIFLLGGGTAIFQNTIVHGTGTSCAGSGSFQSLGNNLESGNSCGFNGPMDLINTDPDLLPLADNGGPTKTMALTPCSPAVDAAYDGACEPADQRGVTRPEGSHCDIGAYEMPQGQPFAIRFCRDEEKLGWGAEQDATAYDLAWSRVSIWGTTFHGDFSSFRAPDEIAGCDPACAIPGRIYDTGCTPPPTLGMLDMWLVRPIGSVDESWDGAGTQAHTRDDLPSAPNPLGVPAELVCP